MPEFCKFPECTDGNTSNAAFIACSKCSVRPATCKFCHTVAAMGEAVCQSLEEAHKVTAARPYGCPWIA